MGKGCQSQRLSEEHGRLWCDERGVRKGGQRPLIESPLMLTFLLLQLLPNPKPARTCIQAGKLPSDVDIEIEAIATY